MKSVPGIRFIDDAFTWTYGFFLESELFKRKIISLGPQLGEDITVHAKLPADWQALSKRGGPPDNPGPATLPGFAMQSQSSHLAPMLDHSPTYAAVNYDVLGNAHPCPTRPGSIVVLLCLTSNWTEAHGGEIFFYKDASRGEIIQASNPYFMRAIVFDGAIPYCVRMPTRTAVSPKLTATFVMNQGPRSEALLGRSA